MIRISVLALAVLALAAAAPGGKASAAPSVTITIESGAVAPGGLVHVALDVSAPAPGLGAYQVEVHYDAAALFAQSCQKTSGLCNKDFEPGIIGFTGISLDGKSGDFTLAEIVFQSIGSSAENVVLDVSAKVLVSPAMVDLEPSAQITDGMVQVTAAAPPANPPGDVNCDGALTMKDGLDLLLDIAAVSEAACPVFGDVNCDGRVDSGDVATILRWLGELPLGLGPTCPALGVLG